MNDAEALLRKATRNRTGFSPGVFQPWACAHRQSESVTRRLQPYQQLIALTPDDDDAYAGLGRSHAYTGDTSFCCRGISASRSSLNPEVPGYVIWRWRTCLRRWASRRTPWHIIEARFEFEAGTSAKATGAWRTSRLAASNNVKSMRWRSRFKSSTLSRSRSHQLRVCARKGYEDKKDYSGMGSLPRRKPVAASAGQL